ncbi:SpoIIIAH-like protein [compost metagenome]
MQAKVESLEDILGQTYSNAIVLDEGEKYKAVVQVANKLDAKQAQSIIDLMIKELGVSKESVSVQYLK